MAGVGPVSWRTGLTRDEQTAFMALANALNMTPEAAWAEAQAEGFTSPKDALGYTSQTLGARSPQQAVEFAYGVPGGIGPPRFGRARRGLAEEMEALADWARRMNDWCNSPAAAAYLTARLGEKWIKRFR